MILETTQHDYACLIGGMAPRSLSLADTAIASPEILTMLSDVADRVRETFEPTSWLLVEDGMIVGLCSITRPPQDGIVDIGYGVAPSCRKRGVATRAIAEIVAWAQSRPDVAAVTAETSTGNAASQTVLTRNGFVRVGERHDEDDGSLICWQRPTA